MTGPTVIDRLAQARVCAEVYICPSDGAVYGACRDRTVPGTRFCAEHLIAHLRDGH